MEKVEKVADTESPLCLALSYIARGWPVFPARAKEEMDPNTGEFLAPKTPYTPNGFRGASKTERIIREWWKRQPDAMTAVPTGAPIGAWVLDLDIKPGIGDGHDWLADMEAKHGALPTTARAKTMGGGTHVFFRHVDGVRNRGGLGIAVDVRGDGGYIIAPGSRVADGRQYAWLDGHHMDSTPIADAPQWLLDLVLPRERTPAPTSAYTHTPGRNTPYVERAVEAELNDLATTGQGGRGYQLNRSAFNLGQLVGAGVLERGTAEHQLYEAAIACGVAQTDGERETRAKIKRGLDAGQRQPRHIPESQFAANDNTRLVDISEMIERGLAKARAKRGESDGVRIITATPSMSEESTQTSDVDTTSNTLPAVQPEVLEESTTSSAQPIFITPFKWIDPATLPRRDFVFGTHYIRKYVSVTVSPGGLGKTSNSIAEALSMTSGKRILRMDAAPQRKVWLFNAEDPRDEMERRIMAACLHYKLKPADFEGRLFLDTGREQELVVAKEDKREGVKIVVPVVEAIVELIERNGIDVMIIDPFVSTHGVNENDNGAIDKVAKLWAQIADYTNCSIDVVHHLRKVADREATVEDARGAVSLIGAARSVRVLNRMTEEQAVEAMVRTDERFSYFSITQGKSNLTKMSGGLKWRKLETVSLGNGGVRPGKGGTGNLGGGVSDTAGVVDEFPWPGADKIMEGLTDQNLADLKNVLRNGEEWKSAPQGKPWAGAAIARVLGVDAEDKGEKKRMTRMLKTLIDQGVLVDDYVPTRTGKPAKVVLPAAA